VMRNVSATTWLRKELLNKIRVTTCLGEAGISFLQTSLGRELLCPLEHWDRGFESH
jgi:hypothetical protein